MYISDRDALQFASRIILILVPFFSSLFGTWSWVVEILLLFAIFIHSRSAGLRFTAILLTVGYVASLIPAGGGLTQIGYTPWAGILLLGLKERGLPTSHSMFWGLMAAALLSALPAVPLMGQILQPESMQQRIQSAMELYEQQGTLSAIEKQGMSRLEFEKYLNLAIPVYYQILPALAGIMGAAVLSISYWIYRFSIKRIMKMTPFLLYRLPWYTVWVTIIGLAAYLGGDYIGSQPVKIVGMNIMAVISALSFIIGLSCLSYLLRNPKVPRFIFLAIILSIIFFPLYIIVGLLMVGLFDPVFNFRRIPEKNEEAK